MAKVTQIMLAVYNQLHTVVLAVYIPPLHLIQLMVSEAEKSLTRF